MDLSVEHQFVRDFAASIAYVGSMLNICSTDGRQSDYDLLSWRQPQPGSTHIFPL